MRKYSATFFILVPFINLIIFILLGIGIHRLMWDDTINKKEITNKTQSGELWEIFDVSNSNTVIIVYQNRTSESIIAFRGNSLDAIQNTINDCNYGDYATSYWQGEYTELDITDTLEFKEYIENYTDVDIYKFENIKTYSLDSYLGYDATSNNGLSIATILVILVLIFVYFIFTIIEIAIAILIKAIVIKIRG